MRDALSEGGATKVLGLSNTALAVTKGVITAVIATLTIAFLTLFMLLEGTGLDGANRAFVRREAAALALDRPGLLPTSAATSPEISRSA